MEGARQGVQVYPQSLYKHFITLCIMYVFGHKDALVHYVESVLLCGSWGRGTQVLWPWQQVP